jgi:hypothetical protein
MGEYWEELKKNFKLEDFLIALVKDLLDIVGVDLIKGATKALGQTAAKARRQYRTDHQSPFDPCESEGMD